MKLISLVTILLMSAGLVGCSGEPSNGDIEAAMKKNLDDTKTQMSTAGGAFGKNMAEKMPSLVSVSKTGCTPRQPSGFTCDIDIEVQKVGEKETSKTPAKVSFVKSDGTWAMLEE
jgi:hypothetical protein